ncbi:hypothetical protein K1719_016402 [Acacia pycnantha]|nr:hypothetical protein K1719_016402 [Acacia pycnantha]
MLSGKLPEDLMIEIMMRLPVKSLLRFKFVAKSWYDLISDPSFITKQFEWSNSITKKRCLKLIFQNHIHSNLPPSISLLSEREGRCVVQDLDLPFPRNGLEHILVYGQCNGILFLRGVYRVYREYVGALFLWNPATKEIKAIPASHRHQQRPIVFVGLFGFGFDPITKDYKIVQVLYSPSSGEQTVVEVYNLSTNSWRTITVDVPIFKFNIQYGQCYLNGAYHWLAGDHNKFIVSFDFSKEVFGIIQSPPLVTSSPSKDKSFLAVVDDCLAWVTTDNLKESRVEIWVMKYGVESSWTKKFEIRPYRRLIRFFGFWGDNEILVKEHIIGPLISYNLRNQQRGRLQIYFQQLTTKDYVESLFPLGGKRKHRKL